MGTGGDALIAGQHDFSDTRDAVCVCGHGRSLHVTQPEVEPHSPGPCAACAERHGDFAASRPAPCPAFIEQ